MFTKASLEQCRTSAMELFFISVKPYFKNILNSIELPLGCIFYATQSFVKKAYNCEKFWRKSLLLIEHCFFCFFFKVQNYAMECRHQ